MRAVSDGRWKLIRYPDVDHTQLFDLDTDPDERSDRAAEPAMRPRIERLTMLLREWQAKCGDTLPLTAANPKPKALDLSRQTREVDPWQPAWIRRKYFGLE